MMRRAVISIGAIAFWLVLASPAMAIEDPGPRGPAVEVEGELNSEGYSFANRISYYEQGDKLGGNVPEPSIFVWRNQLFPTVAIDPVNNITYCPPGQVHLIAWRTLTAFGEATIGFNEGDTLLFWDVGDDGLRVPGSENLPLPGGPDSEDIWYVHVCVGPSTPAVEAIIEGLVPEPFVGLNPRPGFGGITGFETWGWYEQDAAYGPAPDLDDIVLEVRDPRWGELYTVDAHIWAYQYEWDFGDGTPSRVVTRFGTDDNLPFSASTTHIYETKGTWPVTLTVTWTGEYTYTGYTGVEVLTPSDRIATSDYPVQEVVTRTVATP